MGVPSPSLRLGFNFWTQCRLHEHGLLGLSSEGSNPSSVKLPSKLQFKMLFSFRHYKLISLLACVVIPTVVPYLWGESLWLSYFTAFALRYIATLNVTWCVNSLAHMFGNKPYDVNINPSENLLVSTIAGGEGFHNYHHTFPQDYATSEFGTKGNITTRVINFFARIGWAYDMKVTPREVVIKRMMRTGKLRDIKSD